jgi:hypothetical protein
LNGLTCGWPVQRRFPGFTRTGTRALSPGGTTTRADPSSYLSAASSSRPSRAKAAGALPLVRTSTRKSLLACAGSMEAAMSSKGLRVNVPTATLPGRWRAIARPA